MNVQRRINKFESIIDSNISPRAKNNNNNTNSNSNYYAFDSTGAMNLDNNRVFNTNMVATKVRNGTNSTNHEATIPTGGNHRFNYPVLSLHSEEKKSSDDGKVGISKPAENTNNNKNISNRNAVSKFHNHRLVGASPFTGGNGNSNSEPTTQVSTKPLSSGTTTTTIASQNRRNRLLHQQPKAVLSQRPSDRWTKPGEGTADVNLTTDGVTDTKETPESYRNVSNNQQEPKQLDKLISNYPETSSIDSAKELTTMTTATTAMSSSFSQGSGTPTRPQHIRPTPQLRTGRRSARTATPSPPPPSMNPNTTSSQIDPIHPQSAGNNKIQKPVTNQPSSRSPSPFRPTRRLSTMDFQTRNAIDFQPRNESNANNPSTAPQSIPSKKEAINVGIAKRSDSIISNTVRHVGKVQAEDLTEKIHHSRGLNVQSSNNKLNPTQISTVTPVSLQGQNQMPSPSANAANINHGKVEVNTTTGSSPTSSTLSPQTFARRSIVANKAKYHAGLALRRQHTRQANNGRIDETNDVVSQSDEMIETTSHFRSNTASNFENSPRTTSPYNDHSFHSTRDLNFSPTGDVRLIRSFPPQTSGSDFDSNPYGNVSSSLYDKAVKRHVMPGGRQISPVATRASISQQLHSKIPSPRPSSQYESHQIDPSSPSVALPSINHRYSSFSPNHPSITGGGATQAGMSYNDDEVTLTSVMQIVVGPGENPKQSTSIPGNNGDNPRFVQSSSTASESIVAKERSSKNAKRGGKTNAFPTGHKVHVSQSSSSDYITDAEETIDEGLNGKRVLEGHSSPLPTPKYSQENGYLAQTMSHTPTIRRDGIGQTRGGTHNTTPKDDETFDYGDRDEDDGVYDDDDDSQDSLSYAQRREKEQREKVARKAAAAAAKAELDGPFLKTDDFDHYRKTFDTPLARTAFVVAGAATIGHVVCGAVGVLLGPAAVGIGMGYLLIPVEQRQHMNKKATEAINNAREAAFEATDKMSTSCATTYQYSGIAEHVPIDIPHCCSGLTGMGIDHSDPSAGEDNCILDTKKPFDNHPNSSTNAGDGRHTYNGTGGASFIPDSGTNGNSNRSLQMPSHKDGRSHFPSPSQVLGGGRARDRKKAKVACLREGKVIPINEIHSMEPTMQPKAWLDILASADTSQRDKMEAIEEIIILAKDKQRARVLVDEGILDTLMWTIGRYFEKRDYDPSVVSVKWSNPTVSQDEEETARRVAALCLTLGKSYCAAMHTDGDLLLMSLYDRGSVPEERQLAQMLYEVPHHARTTVTDDPTIIRPKEETFLLKQLTLPQAEELAIRIKDIMSTPVDLK